MKYIVLSEGADWPSHYRFTGRRCLRTLGAICEWDGTPLTDDESEEAKLSEQTPAEKEALTKLVSFHFPTKGWMMNEKELDDEIAKAVAHSDWVYDLVYGHCRICGKPRVKYSHKECREKAKKQMLEDDTIRKDE